MPALAVPVPERKTGLSAVRDLPEAPHPDRVRLRYLQVGEDRAVKEARVPAGTTLFDAASWNGVAIDSTCGGHGTCKKCKVRVVAGSAELSSVDPRAFSPDELRNGWRLACRAAAQEDMTIEVPPLQTRPKAALAGVGRHVILRPAVQKRYVELDEPTLEDQRSDLERLLDAIDDIEPRVPLDVVRTLVHTLRESDWKVTAVLADNLLIDVEAGDTSGRRHAIAFDLGTTTVVATLLDLETGQPRAVRSILNAQQPFGADVISRISATMMDDDALGRLQEHAHETLRMLTAEVCDEAGVDPRDVYEIVVTGNVTMLQLALGIDPEPLSMAPFTIAARRLPEASASDFGLAVHERAPAVLFPALGAYVGPDIVAGILATGLTLDRRDRLFIDVGTNSEIVLGSSARALACAAPAGPAFEAAQIRCGMRAADGAVEGVKLVEGEVQLTVIGDMEPRGLCGSGLVDAVAELVGAGILDHSGRFVAGSSERLDKIGEETVFHLAEGVYLSQRDVRELQFAKASIATGWQILCRDLGIDPAEISQVLLGGSFGSYLTPASAVKIGLVPNLPVTRIVAAGNVAGEGAKIAALSVTERAAANAVLDEVEYVELSGRADFNDLFIDQLAFPG
ncbi:MAG TPA: ASKHA domain-containing protein [Gaiellaceae bacterium]|nr:ASKHA domain-containing protein [Gaiellaceae bacterium]